MKRFFATTVGHFLQQVINYLFPNEKINHVYGTVVPTGMEQYSCQLHGCLPA
jgi:hypothetical protein